LEWLAQTTDEHHRLKRVLAFIELFYRAGVCDPTMPYRVWVKLMGDAEPPFAYSGIGAFQIQRTPGGGMFDPEVLWWNKSLLERPH
jgi:hypothetical protein